MKALAALTALFLFSNATLCAKSGDSKRLVKDLESSDPSARAQAQSELRAYRFTDVVKLVADFGDGTNPDVRILMTQVLGELGGPESAKYLQKLFFKEKVDKVRRAILVQLTGLIPTDSEAYNFYSRVIVSDRNLELRRLAVSQVALLGKYVEYHREVIHVLDRAARKDPDSTNRSLAILLMAFLSENKSDGFRIISDALGNPDTIVRRKAIELIVESRDPFYLERLQTVAETDSDPQVRDLAQRAITSLKP